MFKKIIFLIVIFIFSACSRPDAVGPNEKTLAPTAPEVPDVELGQDDPYKEILKQIEKKEFIIKGVYYEYDSDGRVVTFGDMPVQNIISFNGILKNVDFIETQDYEYPSETKKYVVVSAEIENEFYKFIEPCKISVLCDIKNNKIDEFYHNLNETAEGESLIITPTVTFNNEFLYEHNLTIKYFNRSIMESGELEFSRDNVVDIAFFDTSFYSDFGFQSNMRITLSSGDVLSTHSNALIKYQPKPGISDAELWNINLTNETFYYDVYE